MILLGLVLILLGVAGGLGVYLLSASTTQPDVQLSALGVTLATHPVNLFYAGVVVGLLLWLGYVVLRAGIRRSSRRRAQAKVAAQEAKDAQAAKEREWKAQHEAEVAARKEAEDKLAREPARNPQPNPSTSEPSDASEPRRP